MIKLLKPRSDIFLVTATKPAELGKMFLRAQEFFESPEREFYRKFFTVDKFKAYYKKWISSNGTWSYYTDYYGYNIPGDVYRAYLKTFTTRHEPEEVDLNVMLGVHRNALPRRFYLIGSDASDTTTIDHEIAHAFFHIDASYRKKILALQRGNDFEDIDEYLRSNMYRTSVFEDERASYLMFEGPILRRNGVSLKSLLSVRKSMLEVFKEYRRSLKPLSHW